MANLKSNNYHFLKLNINRSQYWDFYVNHEFAGFTKNVYTGMTTDGLSSYINLCYDKCISGDTWIVGDDMFTWDKAVSNVDRLNNIGYTGIDNGLFAYRKDRIMNKDFHNIITASKQELGIGDNRLKLHIVSGNTQEYEYPIHLEECEAILNGGFFQGFFKTECGEYEILPSKFQDEDTWELEFVLNKTELEPESDKTLNDKHPNNKGMFFFIGARAENKFIYLYDEKDKEGKEACHTLDIGDFVENGEIDKKDYVIGNFLNANPNWDYYNPLDDYVSNNYYNPQLYEYDGIDDYTDAIDFSVFEEKPKLIDESIEHEVIDMCDCKSSLYEYTTITHACGCCGYSKRIKKTKKETEVIYDGYHDFLFGGDYLDGLDDIGDCDIDYLEEDMDIMSFNYEVDNGLDLKTAGYYRLYTDNKFMLFDRSCDGYTAHNWVDGSKMMYYGRKNKFKGNLFLLMNRTCTGYTVNNIQPLIDEANQDYDVYKDIYNNALGFRITDDGKIGYRFLGKDCSISGSNKTKIYEGYSLENVVKNEIYSVIHIRITCVANEMMFHFYVNGKLVYISNWIPKLSMKELDEIPEKQEGVPYNISIGGGTQGLADVVQQNYYLPPSRLYPLEEYFAGTFIGKLKSFKFYTSKKEFDEILANSKWELSNIE